MFSYCGRSLQVAVICGCWMSDLYQMTGRKNTKNINVKMMKNYLFPGCLTKLMSNRFKLEITKMSEMNTGRLSHHKIVQPRANEIRKLNYIRISHCFILIKNCNRISFSFSFAHLILSSHIDR